MGNSESMEVYTGKDDEFIPMSVVAKKWKYDEYHLIDWAVKNEFELYCLQPTCPSLNDSPKIWLLVGRLAHYFLNGRTSITIPLGALCVRVHPFGTTSSSLQCETDYLPDNPDDYMLKQVGLPGCLPDLKVTIDIRDLHLHCSEIAAMEKKHPELFVEVSETKTDSAPVPEETNTTTTEPLKITEESAPNADDEANAPLLNKDDSKPLASSPADVNEAATGEKELPLPTGIDNKSNFTAQAEKPKSTRQPKKLKQKTELPLNGGSVEPKISKEDQGVPVYLQIYEIVNNPKKGTKGKLRMSRSKWLAGVKSGKFPPPYDWGDRTNRWRLSDINLIIELMEKGETWADHIARTTKSETSPTQAT